MADDERGTRGGTGAERRDTTHVGEPVPPKAMGVRDEDLEPHAGLRYIARMFKVLAL